MFGWFKKKAPPNRPDFSTIDSRAKAEELFVRGELEQLFVVPLEFGGQDIPLNILYVPIGVAAVKSRIDNNVIGPLASQGKVTKYTARPEYVTVQPAGSNLGVGRPWRWAVSAAWR